ncbi:HEPN domain-containing protein [Chitinophaga sp. CF118]|uniref:HEPN domain-containing protein n=1 Tax=Chitinophaga sp. CF118 TaxID=1884367 RepID=UPI0008EDECAE|nr:HEPN domain-containing protein [Chitinophaga sp. CF118]SFE67665.1 HEPN domain-containing protein [Chitinophaga sp. CF118]
MLTTFQYLPQGQLPQLIQLVQKIVRAIRPNKVICYGNRITTMQGWNSFLEEDTCKTVIHPTYDFLILTNDGEKRADHETVQIAEQQATPLGCEVTVIVQQLGAANKALENGSRFISTVYRKGVLVYDGDGLPLTIPPEEPDIAILRNRIETNWNKCFGIAQCFFKTATYCFDNGWYEQATFDLHQSAQHTCMAMLKAFSGYRSNTHNLSRLLALITTFSYQPIAIFPCLTEEETDLFNTLNRAYSEARYNEKYTVSAETVQILMERVANLLTLAQRLYEEKLLSLKNSQPILFPLNVANEPA